MNKKIIVLVSIIAATILGFKSNDAFKTLGLKFAAPTVFDRANVANPEAGEIIYDTSDAKFYGFDQTSNWVQLNYEEPPPPVASLPAGIIMPYGGTTAPDGYLIADGSAVSRTTYAALYAAIGNAFGSGNGTTTFNLPDLRGRFLRGVDGTANRDPDKSTRVAMTTGGNSGNAIGSVQADQFKSHNHNIRFAGSGYQNYGVGVGSDNTQVDAAISNAGGAETRPINANVNYIIKL
jgi:microcystin-dependent protein